MIFQIRSFLSYYWKATTLHHIHSPFSFQLLEVMLDTKRKYYDFEMLEAYRKRLLKNNTLLSVEDHGAGSRVNNQKSRKVSTIAKSALSSKVQCQQIFRLIQELKPNTILELGTSLGLSACYMAKARSKTTVHTIEGSQSIYNFANTEFKAFELSNIKSHNGRFDQVLPNLLEAHDFDLIFIDGHHDYQATLNYFHQIKQKVNKDCIFIFDDINWSKGMQKAWKELKQMEGVKLSIDFFYYGILFFNVETKEVLHHTIIPLKQKPFKLGFFN